VEGNEKADEWAKLAVEEPDTRGEEGLEWFAYLDRPEVRSMPLPRSLANIKREIAQKKWAEARQWAGGQTSKKKYKMPESQRPDGTVAGSTKRLASRYYQLRTGHCRTGSTCTGQRLAQQPSAGGAGAQHRRGTNSQGVSEVEGAAEDLVEGGTQGDREREAAVEGT